MATKFKLSKASWIIIASAVSITALAILFFKNIDKVSHEVDHGYSIEAKRNEFLAAEMFLQELNIAFETRKDYSVLDGELAQSDTLLINSSRIGMSATRREAMQQWVRQGGHLVLLATEAYESEFNASRDTFLDELGFRYYPNSDDYYFGEDYLYFDEDEEDEITQLKFESSEQPSKVYFYANGYIEDTSGDASFVAGPYEEEHFIQYQLGDGLVTIMMDFSQWKNYRIEQYDHAMFLAQLIGRSPKAWLIYNQVQPTLLSIMLNNAPLVSFSSALILFLLLAGAVWRIGAPKADQLPVNREIMQHISAAGAFAYRDDRGFNLLQQLLLLIERRMEQLVFGYSKLSHQQQLKKLSEVTNITTEQLASLWNNESTNAEVFVKKVQLIQNIRKQL